MLIDEKQNNMHCQHEYVTTYIYKAHDSAIIGKKRKCTECDRMEYSSIFPSPNANDAISYHPYSDNLLRWITENFSANKKVYKTSISILALVQLYDRSEALVTTDIMEMHLIECGYIVSESRQVNISMPSLRKYQSSLV